MSRGPTLDNLRKRAIMLQKVRAFFAERQILEVDCCALNPRASIDSHIDSIAAEPADSQTGFLHTSPEYAMKRLLTEGLGDIYFLGHVFRKSDIGHLHNPEFTMIEWYRLNTHFPNFIQEACELLFLFLGPLPIATVTYRQAFLQHVDLDYLEATLSQLQKKAADFGAEGALKWNKETCIHFLLSHAVEPNLGIEQLTILTDYPPDEAALARIVEKNGLFVAKRFEIYYRGIELANGYHELSDASELRRRFEKQNSERLRLNKKPYLLDEAFLKAMEKGLPESCGVAMGFDRALMLQCKAKTIEDVLAFCWPRDISIQSE